MFDTDDELAEQDNVTKGSLGQIAKQRLSVLLKEVTFQRGTIARTMAFAIDHADAATEVKKKRKKKEITLQKLTSMLFFRLLIYYVNPY